MARIVGRERISIGDSVIIDDFAFLVGGARTAIGSFIHIASFVSVTGGGELVMEDFSGISAGSRVYTGNEDYLGGCLTNPTIPEPFRVAARSFVRVGRHAIVGANSVILPGVTLGEGCVVGAGSLVTKDCEPWTVYVGTPARPMKARRRDRIEELELQFRRVAYGPDGGYIPNCRRGGKA
ncbi:MAG: acyltransferase [Candidatus Eisenbacteria bacterium]|nr:acyltransferase [Candidatus Eisenbacteria bacterium]